MVSPGSHRSEQLSDLRGSYGRSSVGADGVASGWLTDDPNTMTPTVC
jgi:hypothetical protein